MPSLYARRRRTQGRLLSPAMKLLVIVAALALAQVAAAQQAAPPCPPPPTRPTPPPTRDPHTPGYVDGQGTARRRRSAGRRRRQLHHRPDAHARAGNGRAGRRAAGTVYNFTMSSADSKIYPGIARDAGHVRHARSERSGEARRDDQPSGSVHAPGRRLRSEAIRPRHRRAVHRRRRRTRPAALHGARQSDRAEDACR